MQGYAPQPNAKHREKKDQHIHLDFKKKIQKNLQSRLRHLGMRGVTIKMTAANMILW